MSEDRPIAPSPARLQLARAAGVRPDARWLGTGIACVSVSALLSGVDGASVAQALRIGQIDPAGAIVSVRLALQLAGVGAVAVVVAAIVVRVLVGGLGPVRREAARRLDAPPVRLSVGVLGLVVLALLVAGLLSVSGVLAGASRAVAAPTGGLVALWWGWAQRALLVMGGLSIAAGLLEVIVWHSAARRALRITVARGRRDAREHQRKSPL